MSLLPLDPTALLLGGMTLLCLLWWLSTRRPPGLPPGPGPALPLLGHLHLVPKDPRAQFWAWKRQYGDVFSLYMGGELVVVLASYSAIREALVTLADIFSDRPQNLMSSTFRNEGILHASGPTWKEQRKTGLEILRAMGMGKNVLAEKIQEEITYYIQSIKDHQGAPVDLTQLTQISISNNICSILFGKRFDYQDPEFISYLKIIESNFTLFRGTATLHFLPFLAHIPCDPFGLEKLVTNLKHLLGYLDKHVDEHKKILDSEDKTLEAKDFIYSYLLQIEKQKTAGNVNSTLNDNNLRRSLANLLQAGTETTSTALRWALLFFLHYPHVQDKCFKEISDVIGPHRPPTMQDKPNLTYLEATIYEVLRRSDVVPLAVTHATSRDVKLRDYVIPKGARVIPFLSSALMEPDIWRDPENFRPERFIDPEGKLVIPEEFIPFSTGRRVCLGESMARMELFLYLATLIQHFHFLPPEDGQLPSLEGVLGVTHIPQPYKIRAVPRM